jgi:DNA-binding LacI/PurR family transcriptional regulator
MVLLYRSSPLSLKIPSITVENTEITHRLMEHLIQVHGKRRILHMRGPVHQEDSIRREAGYKSALAANGIPFDENLVLTGDFERDIAYQALDEFLGSEKRVAFDAIFTGDDDAAVGVLRALHKYGYKVPDDIAVVGFDDLSVSPFLNPALTTVRAPTETVGRIAAEKLFSILENQSSNEAVILPTEIIFRRSCGCHA